MQLGTAHIGNDMPARGFQEVKGPVKLIQGAKIAHSFYSLCQSVPLYHFKLAYVVLHMAGRWPILLY